MYKVVLKSIIIVSSLWITSCNYQTKKKDPNIYKGEIQFTDTICQLGTFTLTADSVYTNEFIFQNTGHVPVAILNVVPSCKCITVHYTQGVIQPGKTGKINVTFDGKQAAPGYFNKSVRVRINANRVYTLRMTGTISK
ncbi:DUF1573 domain-containing protein [uncultured Bacteroides sp.]|jgi:hypothetical protein|uniref:DUF1573 domain-containing protein n=1 Tax=uncultured Bacteroides sp. TaxID=162156 RepID=UPI002639C957|nr:DUF1573 domain-containing protein [uncultured Bacteroides sp.]